PDRSLVKINPMANWKRRDAWAYLKEYDLPHSPLYDLGYASIGCAPCTRMVFPGEDERAGRWSGLLKTECGIHVREASLQADDSVVVAQVLCGALLRAIAQREVAEPDDLRLPVAPGGLPGFPDPLHEGRGALGPPAAARPPDPPPRGPGQRGR